MKKTINYIILVIALYCGFGIISMANESDSNYDMNYYSRFQGKNIEINVYNWGEYISDGEDGLIDVNAEFTKITGIKVNYMNYDSCQAMYAKMKSDAVQYDIVVPSDYMVERLIKEKMLQPINFDNIPNIKYIDKKYLNSAYDPEQKYSVPYIVSRLGIIYNRNMVDEKDVKGWDLLWNDTYSNDILMFRNSNDAFAVALMALGYSINTEKRDELNAAAKKLEEQRPLVQAYVMDQVFDKMQNNEAAIAVYYVGDYYSMKSVNDDLELFVPDKTNMFVDNLCIPKSSKNKLAAEMYINFINEPNVASENIQYINYSTPNKAAWELLPDEMKQNKDYYPDEEDIANDEICTNLSEESYAYIDRLWTDVLADSSEGNPMFMPSLLIGCVFGIIGSQLFWRKRKKKHKHY